MSLSISIYSMGTEIPEGVTCVTDQPWGNIFAAKDRLYYIQLQKAFIPLIGFPPDCPVTNFAEYSDRYAYVVRFPTHAHYREFRALLATFVGPNENLF